MIQNYFLKGFLHKRAYLRFFSTSELIKKYFAQIQKSRFNVARCLKILGYKIVLKNVMFVSEHELAFHITNNGRLERQTKCSDILLEAKA